MFVYQVFSCDFQCLVYSSNVGQVTLLNCFLFESSSGCTNACGGPCPCCMTMCARFASASPWCAASFDRGRECLSLVGIGTSGIPKAWTQNCLLSFVQVSYWKTVFSLGECFLSFWGKTRFSVFLVFPCCQRTASCCCMAAV